MKMFRTLVIAIAAGCFSLSALAATEITKEQAKENNYEKVGSVNLAKKATASPTDIKEALSKLADEKGGKYFVIIAEGGNNQIEATAEVYK
ncbi:YdgH/BhsA/McbA family protein [Pragia fontium]|uniref:YdgH/BhsA/McbA-like domain-containing protein n=2 Tax=Pragia fontium TaxID=82985 RepID=A0AAJ5BI74_9GAMM|nr:DUF1471 domain-containing protein [Pragia fontium]GKX64558.1 hypothetical protein SOASR032_31270 [Pragia fontium]SFD24543.1 Protein of unknown function [Pragia fontium DSM 5563 = ATCC 49100]SUB81072.1 Multiple stress resistance protein BhsA precursor [Pragia fontium]VEJ52988.1 Multiple stress resistance protein BhsA precursor [Pragia fontium]